ncbi:MAG TPA: TIR domain-containing protein [Candidatus Binatia bacterium]|jgi:ubiquinone/menaquinone biosynthesis C-methylase UbiE
MLKAINREHVQRIRVFVSSPNDVKAERDLLDGVVDEINRTMGDAGSFVLQLFKWERNVIPQIDQTPQGVIDNQMPDCDVYLGILRTRFGTPTGNYGSGTEQEFRAALERFNSQGKPWISFYFYNGPVELKTREEREQYDKVCEFRDELERKGVVGRYKRTRGSRDAFVEQVRSNLIKLVQQFANEAEKDDQLREEVAPVATSPVESTINSDAMDIFISYAKEDREVARRISTLFEDQGWSVWWDRKIPIGRTWHSMLEEALRNMRCMVVLWSANSIISDWVKDEAEEGKTQGKLIPILIDSVKPPVGFRGIQTADLIGWNGNSSLPGLQSLLVDMRKIIQPSREADDLRDKVTQGARASGPAPSAIVIQDTSREAQDLIGPSYTLDNNYYFSDWNPAFDMLVAKPLGLARADHCVDFIKRLENCDAVVERSKSVFAPGKDPLVDTEDLLFQSPSYGRIKFRKIAALINDQKGNPLNWTVNLNITSAEKEAELWQDLEQKLQEVVNWSRYAVSYDKLLDVFTDYHDLVDLVIRQVGNAPLCADLGAGTGNATLKLLETEPTRQVWAVESNEMMLQYLRQKVGSHSGRLTAIKDDIVRLGALRYQNDYFDAAIMLNVLYAVQDPLACLRQAYRILKPGGVLALSTPHRDTDVRKLLTKLRDVLQSRGLFESLAEEFETARLVHEKMDHLIHRDTKEDIRNYIEEAGLEICDWRESEYADAVVMIKAVKPCV